MPSAVCTLCHIACAVPLSHFCKSGLKSSHNLRRTVILEKREGEFEAIFVVMQFWLLHVLIYKTDIFPVILCGCKIWCPKSQQEHRLMVFWEEGGEENIWYEREVGMEGCSRNCNQLHVCYCLLDFSNNTIVSCSMRVVKKTRIQSFLTKHKQEEPVGKLKRITKYSDLESRRLGGMYYFIGLW